MKPVLSKHALFKVLYFILAKFKNSIINIFSAKYFKNTLVRECRKGSKLSTLFVRFSLNT